MIKETESEDHRVLELQAMLALILHTVGEPVVVTREALRNGLPEGATIAIDDDLEREAYVFRIEFDERD